MLSMIQNFYADAAKNNIWDLFFWGLGLYGVLYLTWLVFTHMAFRLSPLTDKVLRTKIGSKPVERTVYIWFTAFVFIHLLLTYYFGLNPVLEQWHTLNTELQARVSQITTEAANAAGTANNAEALGASGYFLELLLIIAVTYLPLVLLTLIDGKLIYHYGKKIDRVDVYA